MERDTFLKASAMIVTEYRMRLKNKQDLGGGKTAFYFEKPPGFEFKAGQYVDITLINPPQTDPDGDIRSFSSRQCTSRRASFDHYTGTRHRFQARFAGSPLRYRGRGGGSIWPLYPAHASNKTRDFTGRGNRDCAFFQHDSQRGKGRLSRDLYLFYSNPPGRHGLFAMFPGIGEEKLVRFVPTMTETGKTHHSWTGETGLICSEMLLRYVPRLQGPIYYLAGSPGFVAAMQKMLKGAGVGENDVRCEEFVGYSAGSTLQDSCKVHRAAFAAFLDASRPLQSSLGVQI